MLRRNFLQWFILVFPIWMFIRKSKAERVSMDVVRGQRKNQIMLDEDCLPKTKVGKWEVIYFEC